MARKRRKRGQGTIVKHGDRYRVLFTIGGRKRAVPGMFATLEEADRIRKATLALLKTEKREDVHTTTLLAYGERWFDRRETDGFHRGAAKDRPRWRLHVETAPFATWPLRRIKRVDVTRWVREMMEREAVSPVVKNGKTIRRGLGRTLSRQSIVHCLNLLRTCLHDACDEGLIPANPARDARVPRMAPTPEKWTFLNEFEIKDLLACKDIPEAHRIVYAIAIFTGLRKGELWGLRWEDVVLTGDRPEVAVRHSYNGPPKNGKVRYVPLLKQARLALKRWRDLKPGISSALVWPADHGGTHDGSYSANWNRWKVKAGITRPVRFHDLRHTCASHLVAGTWGRTWRLDEVKKFLGHSSITVTQRYAHLGPEALHGTRKATDANWTGARLAALDDAAGDAMRPKKA